MLDFAIATNKYARVALDNFIHIVDYRSNAHKRRLETLKGKSQIAIDMVKRAVNSGIYADYLLVDSWYSKPSFIKEMNELGLKVITRVANNNKIWNFLGDRNTLNGIYDKYKKLKDIKFGTYGKKVKYKYFSVVVEHKKAGKIKIVFLKTSDKLRAPLKIDKKSHNFQILKKS